MPETKQSPASGNAPAVTPTDTKAAPVTGEKKPDNPVKSTDTKAAPATSEKKPDAPAKPTDTKGTPVPGEKKPDTPVKPTDTKAVPAAGEKKPDTPCKPTDTNATLVPGEKKPDVSIKPTDTKATPAPSKETPDAPSKPTDAKATFPAAETAKDPPKGMQITQVFEDRLEKPDEKALKSLPIPKEGEGFSMRLHPAYFFEFLDHPFSINREVADYKDLYDSIKANGINEPVKARPRKDGGLELLSGHRRHDIAAQLNYPVPVVIVQMDDDSARIEVVDGNLHRQDIPTSELARAAKMKMEALARKAGRRSKMDQLTSPQKRTDQQVAEEMGMSRNQINRLVRIDSLVPELKKQVDDKKLPFNTAVELSYLKPQEQAKVVDFMKKEEVVPSMAQATALKEASREAAKAEAEKPGKTAPATPTANAPQPTLNPKPVPVVDEKKIASIVKPKADPEQKYTFTSTELKEYFPKDRLPTVSEVKRKVFDALDAQKKMEEREKAKQAIKDSAKKPVR